MSTPQEKKAQGPDNALPTKKENTSLKAEVKLGPRKSWRRRLCKWAAGTFLGLLLVLSGGLYYLCFTLSGAQQAFAWAQHFTQGIIGLEGQIVGGNLWSGLEVQKVRVTVPDTIKVQAQALTLRYDLLPALTRGRFRADSIKAQDLQVILLENGALTVPQEPTTEAETASSEPFRLRFPLELEVGQLHVDNFAYLSSQVDVNIASFNALLQAVDDSALMQDGRARGVVVHVKSDSDPKAQCERLAARLSAPARGLTAAPWQEIVEEESATPSKATAVKTFDDGQGVIASMPTVALPLDVTVLDLKLEDARYYQDGFDTQRTEQLNLTATWHGTRLSVLKLSAEHPRGDLLISGIMDFRDFFYLDFNLSGAGTLATQNRDFLGGLLYGLQGRAKVSGSLTDLNAQIDLLNPRDTHIKARLNCLSALLPMEVQVQSFELTYPLFSTQPPEVTLRNLNLLAAGNILGDGFDSKLETLFSGYGFYDYAVDFLGKVSLQGVDIAHLNLSGEYLKSIVEGKVQGRVNYADEISFAGKAELLSSDGGVFSPALKGPFNATTKLNAAIVLPPTPDEKLNVLVNMPTLQAKFNLQGLPAHLQVDTLQGSLMEGFGVKLLSFNQGQNQVEITGLLDPQSDSALSGVINLANLATLAPGVEGDLQASVQASGGLEALEVHLSGRADKIQAGSTRLRKVAFDGRLDTASRAFNLSGVINTLRLAQGLKPARQCVLDLSGSSAQHNLSFACSGANSIFIAARGALNDSLTAWHGALEEFFFNSELSGSVSLHDEVSIALDLAQGSGEVSAFALRTDAGSVEVGQTIFSPGNVTSTVHFNQVDLKSLNDLLPEGVHMSGPVELNAAIKIAHSKPDINLEVSSDNARIFAQGVPLFFDKLRLNSTVKPHRAELNADISLKRGRGSAAIDVAVLDPLGSKRLDGSVKLTNLDLALFMGVGSMFNDLQGMLNIDGALSGNLSKPLFNGEITATGSAEPRYDVGQVESFDVKLLAHGQQGDLSGFIGLNDGKLNLDGALDWSQGAQGKLQVTARRLPAFLMGFGQAFADIDATAQMGDHFAVSGQVTIPQALISVSSLGSSGAMPSSDEIIVPEGGTRVLIQEASAPVPATVDLTVAMGDDVRVSAMGLEARISGQLHINKELTQNDISGQGQLELVDGRADLYGHHFFVNHARASFNGPLTNPGLDVEVVADPEEMEDNVEAGVRVTGNALAPQVTLFSKPSMSQNEIMSYLLYGHGLDKSSNLNDGNNSGMLVGLGVSSLGGLVNSMVGAFGVQNVRVNTAGSGDDTQVQVQGYITRNIRVGYGYGVFNAVGEFKLRYEFMRRLYAEFVSSVDQAVDIIYSFEF